MSTEWQIHQVTLLQEMMRRMHLMGLEPSDEASADGMHFGRQGDAHEFLNRLLTVCIEAAVGARGGSRALELRSQETTLLHHIFGAYALNQLQCQVRARHALHQLQCQMCARAWLALWQPRSGAAKRAAGETGGCAHAGAAFLMHPHPALALS